MVASKLSMIYAGIAFFPRLLSGFLALAINPVKHSDYKRTVLLELRYTLPDPSSYTTRLERKPDDTNHRSHPWTFGRNFSKF